MSGTGPIAVGTSGCEGSLPGLFDMSGNVSEWTDSCSPDPGGGNGSKDNCARRGGDYGDNSQHLACTGSETGSRSETQCFIGFRCCADIAK
jgi:formylglycine-generating enzyme required for sulfatase activity